MSKTVNLRQSSFSTGPRMPWWRVPMVWLVLSGPAVVVVAGVVTAWIAIQGADTVLTAESEKLAERPALQGRNHSATGEAPPAR